MAQQGPPLEDIKKGQDFIRRLIEAEADAQKKVNNATQAKKEKLKAAAGKAQDDLAAFKMEKKNAFEQARANTSSDETMKKELASQTQAENLSVQKQYDANKQSTVKYIVSKILDVPITLTDTQIQSLKTGAV